MQPVDHGPQPGGFSGGLQWVNPGCDEGRRRGEDIVFACKWRFSAEIFCFHGGGGRTAVSVEALLTPRGFRLPESERYPAESG